MHWICFHLEYEHRVDFETESEASGSVCDADNACSDPDCPMLKIRIYEEALRELGIEPGQLIADRLYG